MKAIPWRLTDVIRRINEIQNAICCYPGVARHDRPVPAGNGTEHHTIYHYHFTGSDSSDTGPDESDHEYNGYAGRPAGAADRFDDDYNHAPTEGKSDRHDDHHNRTAA